MLFCFFLLAFLLRWLQSHITKPTAIGNQVELSMELDLDIRYTFCLVLRISLDIHEQFLEVNYEQRVSPSLPSPLSIFNPNWRKLSVHMICCSIRVPSIIKSILMCYHSHKITARRLAGQLANKLCIRRLYARILQTTDRSYTCHDFVVCFRFLLAYPLQEKPSGVGKDIKL